MLQVVMGLGRKNGRPSITFSFTKGDWADAGMSIWFRNSSGENQDGGGGIWTLGNNTYNHNGQGTFSPGSYGTYYTITYYCIEIFDLDTGEILDTTGNLSMAYRRKQPTKWRSM